MIFLNVDVWIVKYKKKLLKVAKVLTINQNDILQNVSFCVQQGQSYSFGAI